MTRALRVMLIVAGSLAGLLAVGLAAAWFLIPRDWIDREAQRQAARLSGATVRWKRLSPGFEGFSLGIRVEGLYLRTPPQGPARAEAAVREVFVRLRILPLFARRVEIASAHVIGAGVALTDRGAPAALGGRSLPPAAAGAALALVLPRLDIEDSDIRTRDPMGGGFDARRFSATARIEGTVAAPRAVHVEARVETLLWKPSAREAAVAMPGPLRLDLEAATRDGGGRLEITQGEVTLGPLQSKLSGEVRAKGPSGGPEVQLLIEGKPQEIRSSDEALRALAARVPATWSTKASWEIRVEGSAASPTQSGRVTMKPLSLQADKNAFQLDQLVATWTTAPDKSYTASARGAGAGVSLALNARGSTAPGGASSGDLVVRAPAARLNGLVPNAPTWNSGEIECRAQFSLRPPAPPAVRWTVTGQGMSGTVPGVSRPVGGLDFNLSGDGKRVDVRSMKATVGSTTASLSGTVEQGKPLGTGTFRATLDRLIVEEWALPAGAKAPPGTQAAATPAAAPPPIPLRAFDAEVAIGELKSGTITLRDVTLPVRFSGGEVSVDPIRGGIGSGTLSGALRVMNLMSSPSYSMHLDVKRAPVEELASGFLPVKLDLSGLVSGVLDLSGPGLPGAAVSDSLRGALSGTIEQGKFRETPAIAGIRNALGLSSGSAGDLAFKTLTHSVRIERGRLLLDRIKGDLGKDLFELGGWMGLDKSLDVDLLLRLDRSRIQGGTALATLARYASDPDGRLPLKIKITGTAAAPRISVQPGRTLQVAGSRMAEQLVRNLVKPAAGDSAAGDSAADAGRDPSIEALKRLLGK